MSRVLVIGATGLAGREVVKECLHRGLGTRGLSRRPDKSKARHDGAEYLAGDASTGAGLAEAMHGVDVVIDAMDGKFGTTRKQLPVAARHIAEAARSAQVPRVVVLSIVNVDQVRFAYYQAKAAQEQAYRDSDGESVVVRTTQFHNLVTGIFDGGRKVGITPVLRGARFQTIATADAAKALVDAALNSGPKNVTVGGPEQLDMAVMARIYRQFTGVRGPKIPLPAPGALGRYWRNGANLVQDGAACGTTYAEWLEERERA
ncbi:NAD(P)H-binding protein [Arthrobacter tecti]